MNDDKRLGASADADRATDAPHGAAFASPPSGSVSTGAGPVDVREGQFAVVKGYSFLTANVLRVDAVTPKLLKTKRTWGNGFSHTGRESVYAAFDSKDEAERLVDAIAGVRGELDRRVTAARDAARKQLAALVDGALSKARGS